jgi:flagellar hook protein FlgE
MFEAFSIALSALNAEGIGVDVTGNNLANVNTVGFKASEVSFRDLISRSLSSSSGLLQIGLGAAQPLTIRRFTQGAIQTTTSSLDAAIQGDGFFVVKDSQGAQLFTRAGSFVFDSGGTLKTITGENVEGWSLTGGVLNTTGAIGNIVFPPGANRAPNASTAFSAQANLDSATAVGQSYSIPAQVFDSLGTPHNLSVTFTNTAPGSWSYAVTIPAADLAAGGTTQVATGTLSFDTNGKLTSPAAGAPVAISVAGLADGAANLSLNWNLYDASGSPLITQYAQASAVSQVGADGNGASQQSSIAIEDGGKVVAQFADGTQQVVAQIALASIINPESLAAVGNNEFGSTFATAQAAIGVPGTGGRGQVLGSSLESSTVDLGREFTNLIRYQRGYEAASKVITTVNTLSGDLNALIQ